MSEMGISSAFSIAYNDYSVVVVNKKPGVAVIPARGEDAALSLKMQLEAMLGSRLFVVHRIDRATSGILLFAKNESIHSELCRQFAMREVKKEYLALVDGRLPDNIICNKSIREFGSGRMGVHPEGKPAETKIEVQQKFVDVTLVRAFPHTGRRHQIRVHLYDFGNPIIGDPLYGKNRPVRGAGRLMLHAFRLSVTLPGLNKMTFTAPVDESWIREGTSFEGVTEEALRE